jgi:hypothetical protein
MKKSLLFGLVALLGATRVYAEDATVLLEPTGDCEVVTYDDQGVAYHLVNGVLERVET